MSLIKNSSVIVAGIIIANIFAYMFHIIAGRMLGVGQYGELGALLSLLVIVALPAGAISSAITKYSAKYNSNKEFHKIGILRKKLLSKIWIVGIVLALIITIFSGLIADYLKIESRVPIILVGVTLIFSIVLPVNRGILQGMKKYKILSINNIIEAVSRLVILVIFLFLGFGSDGALLSYGLGYFIAFLLIFPYIKETETKSKDHIEMKPIFEFIIIVLAVNFLMGSIINLPTLFIKHYYSSEFTGLFTAALTIARMSLFVTGGISMVMFSEVAEKKEKPEKKSVFKKMLFLSIIASVGIAILFAIIPEFFIYILYGTKFLAAAKILRFLGFFMVFYSTLALYINYKLAQK